MDLNSPTTSTDTQLRPEHEPGELDLIGCYHALTEIVKLYLQHGSEWHLTSEIEVDTYMRKMLGIDHKQAKKVRAAIDQVEDASDAIREVILHGLHVNRQNSYHGEAYLRLYGVLNAAYLITGAIRILSNQLMSHKQGAFGERLRGEPLYELRNRIGAHSMDFGKNEDVYHRMVQRDMFRWDGKRSFTSSDRGYQEIDIMADIRAFERTSLSILLELTEGKACRVIKRKSEHFAWMNERLDFVRDRITSSDSL
ncbi:MAG: hypothetical protein IPP83_08255 [Flavobacteriales bacterium]|nr:hypothetical protein [Flavobacteriales bacterium]